MMVVFTPLLGALFLAERMSAVAWAAAGVSVLGLFLLSGAGGDFQPRGDGLVLLCALAFAGHILVTSRAVREHDVGALVAVQLARVRGWSAWRSPPWRGTSRRRRGPRCGRR